MPAAVWGQAVEQRIVDEEAFDQGTQVWIAELEQRRAEAVEQAADVLLGLRDEIVEVELVERYALKAREDDLQRALVQLDLALDAKQLALLEGAEQRLGGVPHASAERAGAIAQLDLQIVDAIAIGTQLLVANQEDLVERIAVDELLHRAPSHGTSRGECERVGRCSLFYVAGARLTGAIAPLNRVAIITDQPAKPSAWAGEGSRKSRRCLPRRARRG